MNREEVDVLAKTIYGEARGESITGMEAIASVVLNRVAFSKQRMSKKYWWGNNIIDVCQKSFQFSCWNLDDVNLGIIKNIKPDDKIFEICKRISMRAVSGILKDNTNGATHYHTKNINPNWAIGKMPSAKIGSHVFYNDIEG